MYNIRFREEDKRELQKAVRKFNKAVRDLNRQENISLQYLPDTIRRYTDIKENIYTRKEFNRIIKSLNAFSKKSNQKIVELPSGENITIWERNQIRYAKRRAFKSLTVELQSLQEGSKAGLMGDKRIQEIKSTLESFDDLESRKGYEYKRTRERLFNVGSFDYELKIANIYKENFLGALEEMKTYDNFDLLKKELEKIKNPKEFYEFIKKSTAIADLFVYYKDKATSQTYGGFASNQDAFNHGLEELGIRIEF